MFQTTRRKFLRIWNSKNTEILRMVLVTLAAHSSSICVGLTQGYSAVLLPQLAAGESSLRVTTEEASWIASLGVISTPFGALLSGLVVDLLGRRSAIIVTSVPFLIGWLSMVFADDVVLLYFGRTVSGLAAGMTTINYLYVAEVTSKEHRGILSAFGPILVSLGVLFVYTMGFVTTWKKAALCSSAFSGLIVVTMLMVPESPAWYVSKRKYKEAYRSLVWLRKDSKIAEIELKAMIECQSELKNTKKAEKSIGKMFGRKLKDFFRALKSPAVYKPFFILLFFFIFQIGSGIYVFLFYATQIFQEFGTNYDESLITVTIGLFRLLMAVVGALLMSKIGRRPLGVVSGLSMSLSIVIVCGYEYAKDYLSPTYQFLPFVSILLHVGFSMIGFLQLPWILNSELFPLHCRGLLSGIVSFFAYLCIFVAVKIYSDLLRMMKLQGLLWGFFFVSLTGSFFVYFFVPETKGKSLKEISNGFLRKSENLAGDDDYGIVSFDKRKPLEKKSDISIVSQRFQMLNPDMFFDKSLVSVKV